MSQKQTTRRQTAAKMGSPTSKGDTRTTSERAARASSAKEKSTNAFDEFVDIVTSRPVKDQKAAYQTLKEASQRG